MVPRLEEDKRGTAADFVGNTLAEEVFGAL
jgi:hypothetical protein